MPMGEFSCSLKQKRKSALHSVPNPAMPALNPKEDIMDPKPAPNTDPEIPILMAPGLRFNPIAATPCF